MMNKKHFTTTMKKHCKLGVIATSAMLAMGCVTTPAPEQSPDGLQLKYQSSSTIAYQKADVNFSEYDKVLILPSQVAFKKNWARDYNRDQTSFSNRIKDEDVIKIKTKVALLFDEIFKEEFSKNGSASLVQEATTGTLILKPAIVNLDVNAPDLPTAGMTKTYVQETGEATLFLEIYDGVSGEILARIMDDEIVGDKGYMQWANRVTNTADAKQTIRKWARTLNEKFEKAHTPINEKTSKK